MTNQADPIVHGDEPAATVLARSVTSPCVGICRIELDFCAGCGRTLEEITNWSGMDDTSKRTVLARIAMGEAPAP